MKPTEREPEGERDPDAEELLRRSLDGDLRAADLLFPRIYDRLRALAGSYMRGERGSHTLQPTALVHEAYVRMLGVERVEWAGETHFFAMAARQMRRVLVEHARGAAAKKRGGELSRLSLHDHQAWTNRTLDIVALDEALGKLADSYPRAAEVAELRLFAGLEVKEVAAALGVSERTVKGDWRLARASLSELLGR